MNSCRSEIGIPIAAALLSLLLTTPPVSSASAQEPVSPTVRKTSEMDGQVQGVDKTNRRQAYAAANAACSQVGRRAQIYYDDIPNRYFKYRCLQNVTLGAWLRGDQGD